MAESKDWMLPFEQRAAKAEERLELLEAIIKRSGFEARAPAGSKEPESADNVTAEKLAAENGKLKYRIHHLVKSLRELDEQHAKIVTSLTTENAKLCYQVKHLIRALKETDANAPDKANAGA